MNRLLRVAQVVGFTAIGALAAPAAMAQVPQLPCGTPPAAVKTSIPFIDITTLIGYQSLAAPSTDTMSDWIGGNGGECTYMECYSQQGGTEIMAPFGQAINLKTLALPFPFGFSGIYVDGGAFIPPFQVQVWSNGLLTFDPSISFNPANFPLTSEPADCEWEGDICGPQTCQNPGAPPYPSTAVTDTFGGFPFVRTYPPPNALIAPWWGDLSLCPNAGQVGWLLTLDENNLPMAIIQWTKATASKPQGDVSMNCEDGDFSACSDGTLKQIPSLPEFNFQVRLHQNSDIDFVYGPTNNLNPSGDCFSGAVGNCGYISGIQSNLVFPDGVRPPLLDYAAQALGCNATTGCLQTQFPSGSSITFKDIFRSVGPDLQVVSINPPGQIPQGGTITIPVMLSNGGGTDSTGQGQVQFYFSAGSQSPTGNPFGTQTIPAYHACSTAPFQAQVTIPAQVPQGGGYLIAEFVPGAESIDQNHSFAYAAVIIGPQEPDLSTVGKLGFTPAAIVGGQQVDVSFQAQNLGEIDAPSVAYGIYLSLNGSISPNDVQIGGGIITDLPPDGAPQTFETHCTVPTTLVSGEYLIGVILNPGNTIREVDQSNNVATGAKLLSVTSPGPSILTTSVQNAQRSSPYSVQLIAAGGDGRYQWSLDSGSLPSGLALTKTGLINGQAEGLGSSTFGVKVTDGIGHVATATLSMTVDDFVAALAIETIILPPGSTAQLYNFKLSAVGGAPPYQWALVPGAGQLPGGVSLVSNGTLTGEPQYDGSASFQVSVTDSLGSVATSPTYTLTVYAAGTLAVGSTVLPTAILGQTYTQTLHYAGGSGPYHWTLIDVQRQPSSPTDPGTDLGPNLPKDLGWYPDQGEIEGVPKQAGVFALTVQVSDSESPPASAVGLVLLTVSTSASFAFQTVQLPGATTNEFYSTKLYTTPPLPPVPANYAVTCQVLNTSQIASDTAKQTLPPGLVLYGDCSIQGVPLEQGNFPFLVQATDTQGGIAIQSFVVQVTNAPPPKSGGCQSASGAPVFAGLVLLALTQARRRRRTESR